MAQAPATTDSLEQARARTLALIDQLSDADLERVHSPLMSPLVWDVGHIAAFEDLWLAHRQAGLPLLRADLADVYDAFETPRAQRGELPFLRRADAEAYLEAVRERVRAIAPGPWDELVARHEHQHIETMLQTLNLARIALGSGERSAAPSAVTSGLELIDVPGGEFPLGAGADGFAYDNERPAHAVRLAPFRIGRVAVTNGDWLSFIADGGYRRPEWWTEDGWRWRSAEGIERPQGWDGDGCEWSLAGGAALEPARPVVHVSWYEADAFARSRGLRLPNEAEWELAASWDGSVKRSWPWGEEPPDPERANLIEASLYAPLAAGALWAGSAPCGALGMVGDVWEWTASEFHGYPGFVAHPYREYSEVFFGRGYRVLRGGSFATSGHVITTTFRNWDLPQRRQIFAGLRVACDA
jgi:iron(II)-dependent oxidoreductase